MRKLLFLALGLGAVAILAPNEGQSQPGPGGPKGKGGALASGYASTGSMTDPMELFDRISGGKTYITPQDMAGLDSLKGDIQAFLGGAGTYEMTREQFSELVEFRKELQKLQRELLLKHLEWQREELLAGRDVVPLGGTGKQGNQIADEQKKKQKEAQAAAEHLTKQQRQLLQQQQQQEQWQQQQAQALNAEFENAFRTHRLDKDGNLTKEAASPQLRAQWDIWDFDANGVIDLQEYKAYKMAERSGWHPTKGGPNPFRPAWAADARPPVYRKGKLPSGLPSWFAELSGDNEEAQIFLYDWRAAGKPDAEFEAMDRNGDGILTADEVLAYLNRDEESKLSLGNIVPLPDPGALVTYANQTGTKLAFTVTGRTDGGIWGTGTYTLDSLLAVAAVHAGAIKAGETGVVIVEIIPSPQGFAGSMQNGVNSGQWGVFPQGAYTVSKLGKDWKKGRKGSGSKPPRDPKPPKTPDQPPQ